ncbi:MAG: hypothetical protein FWC84_05115, partial [Alphaproteobacteria bacterium]|nr:hypothetical protein [Alphaproteobacteria bacterium]
IFGFAEGSDIGPLGEREIESTNIASFGTPSLPFNADTETAFRYVITPDLRLSVGMLTDYFQSPEGDVFNQRNFVTVSGATAELRWNVLNWRTAPIGLTFSFNPEWRRNDPDFGEALQNVSMGFGLLIDKEVVPGKFFAALNLVYEHSCLGAGSCGA